MYQHPALVLRFVTRHFKGQRLQVRTTASHVLVTSRGMLSFSGRRVRIDYLCLYRFLARVPDNDVDRLWRRYHWAPPTCRGWCGSRAGVFWERRRGQLKLREHQWEETASEHGALMGGGASPTHITSTSPLLSTTVLTVCSRQLGVVKFSISCFVSLIYSYIHSLFRTSSMSTLRASRNSLFLCLNCWG